jgi:hypothetical protein
MAQLYLSKEFSELDGLELCVIHWTVTRIGQPPDWRLARSLAMQAVKRDSDFIRQGTLDLDLEGDGPWTLHHFFEWVRYGAWQSGSSYFEDLGTLPIEYPDDSGEFSSATLVYNIGEHGWTNVVPMQLDGAPSEPPAAPQWPEEPGHSLSEQKLRAHADGLALPLRFRGTIIAPVGAHVFYSIHLARRSGLNPMADSGRWIYRREIVV